MPRSKPNIVFITTDHLRYDSLGCNGNTIVQTPHIDALAESGVNFSNNFVQNPVSAPSRASFITGRYPSSHGVKWNFSPVHEWEVPFTEVLKEANYSIAVIGKDHVDQRRHDRTIDHMEARSIRNSKPTNPFVQYVMGRGYKYRTGFELPGFVEKMGAVPSDQPEDCHLDAFVGGRSVDFIDGYNSDRPFFLWVGFYGPHHPYVPTGRFAKMYNPADLPPFDWRSDDLLLKPPEYRVYRNWQGHQFAGFAERSEEAYRRMKAAYYGTVSLIDWQIGKITDALQRKGVLEETVIIFTSDHGELLGEHKIPVKGPFLLDSMIHVPLIVKVNGQEEKVQQRTELCESVDIYPTLVELIGGQPQQYLQGRSLLPLLSEVKGQAKERDFIYAEAVDVFALRSHEWKYIHYTGRPYGELYDLKNDPGETTNLYSKLPSKVNEMRMALWEHKDAVVAEHNHPHFTTFKGRDAETGFEVTHYGTW